MWEYADAYKKDQFAVSYITLHEWIYKKQSGRGRLSDFYNKYGYKKIAYYGLGTLGDIFVSQTILENFPITCVIDKRAKKLQEMYDKVKIVTIDDYDCYKEVDVVVICNTYDYNEIANELIKKGLREEQIISINDVVFAI